jgi:hypothetical protein
MRTGDACKLRRGDRIRVRPHVDRRQRRVTFWRTNAGLRGL